MLKEAGRKFYHPQSEEGKYLNADEVIAHVHVPKDKEKIPYIVGWAGPGRCGSTALLLLLTSNLSQVDKGYYQPLKSIIRHREPDFYLYENDHLVVVKEVFGPRVDQEYYDPIDILSKAGVPPEKMSWVFMLKDPVASFASWYAFTGDDSNPELFAKAQRHTIELYHHYQERGLKVIPFTYELLTNGEENVLRRLLQQVGFMIDNLSLDFNLELLGITSTGDYDSSIENNKMIWGEALRPAHWDAVVKPIALNGRYRYKKGSEKVDLLPQDLKDIVEKLCRSGYNRYLELSRVVLGL